MRTLIYIAVAVWRTASANDAHDLVQVHLQAPSLDSAASDDPRAGTALFAASAEVGSRAEKAGELVARLEVTFSELKGRIGGQTWSQLKEDTQKLINATIQVSTGPIEDAIRMAHKESQKQLVDAIEDLKARTNNVMDLKRYATGKDQELDSCREVEKQLLERADESVAAIRRLGVSRDEACQAKKELATFKWDMFQGVKYNGTCDFGGAGCPDFRELQYYLAPLNEKIYAAKLEYQEKAHACEDTTNAYADARARKVEGAEPYLSQKDRCDLLQHQTRVAMCTFGDRLQEKCAARFDFSNVLKRELTGGEKSVDKQRRAQWESTQKIRCALERVQAGGSVKPKEAAGSDTGPSCEDKIDYTSDVGFINDMSAEMDNVARYQQFTCEEKQVAFSGAWWSTGPTAADYVKILGDDVAVTLEPLGVSPFEFCDSTAATLENPAPPASLAQSQDGVQLHVEQHHASSQRSFTSCGVSSGSLGPSQRDCDQAYDHTGLKGNVAVDGGYQLWTAEASGVYTMKVAGGSGGATLPKGVPGKGGRAEAAFKLNSGDQLVVVVGQRGRDSSEVCGEGGAGGGGGTFVGLLGRGADIFAESAPATLAGKNVTILLAAGGGAGNDDNGWASCAQIYPEGLDGKAELHGGPRPTQAPRRGCDARGSGYAAAGATRTFLAGFSVSAEGWRNQGGFGGGASGCSAGGGGGGYHGGESPEHFGGLWSGVQGGTSYVFQNPAIFVQGTAMGSWEKNDKPDGSGLVAIHGPSQWTHTNGDKATHF